MIGNADNCKAAKSPQVDEQLNRIDDSTSRLHDRIESLFGRLKPVLDSGKEKKSEGGQVPECVLVPVADRIRRAEKSVSCAVEKIEEILRSLEV